MDVLTRLNVMVTLIQQNVTKIGLTAAGLFVVICCIRIMLENDTSPAARAERWAQLKKVFVCALIIAGALALIQLATNLGNML